MEKRKAIVNGRIVTFMERNKRGYGFKSYFRRMMRDEMEAINSGSLWEQGCHKAKVAMRGIVV